MSEFTSSLDPRAWERHSEAVTLLARRLVADRDRADEIAQEARLAAGFDLGVAVRVQRTLVGNRRQPLP